MTAFARFLAILFGVLLAGSLASPREAGAQEFVANQIENLINSETLTVDIQGLSGAISGNVRIESVTVADPQGVFLTASDLALDWSPFSLVRSNVSVENLTAGQIVLERLPVGQPQAAEDETGGGFSLPSITADIDNIAIDEFILGEAIAGTRARLSAQASLSLADDPVNLALSANIERLDQPGRIALDLAFAPAENQLTVDIQASEPQGGLVATLLDIPDRPAVELSVNGSGPLSNFMANGELTIAGEQAASLTARADEIETGRRISLALSVAAARFVPDAYSRYVEGGANLDAQIVLNSDGTYRIEQAQLASNALRLNAEGTLDPSGPGNDLTLSLTSPDQGAIDIAFGETSLSIQSFTAAIDGALSNAALDLAAQLPAGGWGPYRATGVDAAVTSAGFDVTGLRGPLRIVATAEGMAAPEGIQERVLTAPLRIAVDGALTEAGLRFDPSTATTETAELSVQGTAALDFSVFDLTVDSTFQTSALSAALVPIAGETLGLAGNVERTPTGGFRVSDLALDSTGLAIAGNAALENESVSADITGQLKEAASLNASLAGTAEFALEASGPLDKPDIDLTLDGNQLSINGQELADLEVLARGSLASDAPTGTLRITGTLDGAPLEGRADLRTQPNGDRQIADLLIRQGENRVTGDLTLTENFTPLGSIRVAIEDLGPLAALGGLDASGDVNGTIGLDRAADGTPIARPEITASNLTVAGTTLQGAAIDVDVADYLGTPFATGSVTATAIDTGAVALSDLDVQLTREGEFNALAATARANGVPIDLGARARFAPDETVLALTRLIADIPEARVALQDSAQVRIADGTTSLDGFTLAVGDGSLSVEGSIGERLDLTAAMNAVPLAVAGPFVDGVDPAGTISGTAEVSGTSADPTAVFDVSGQDLTTRQLAETDVPPVDLSANGRYADGVLTLTEANATFGEGSLTASGSIGETYDLTATLRELPVGLANGFVPGLDASGDLSGNARVTGPRDDPNATFDLSGSGITTPQVSQAGIQPLTLDVAGAYADGTATIERANIVAGPASLTASGTVGQTLDLEAQLDQFPVGIANAFVENLNAAGTLSGTATATGPVGDPAATIDISGSGITTREIVQSGIQPLSLQLSGTYAEGTARIATGTVNVGDGSLALSGSVGQDLDVDLAIDRLPVGLANGFVEDLGASGTISGTASATGSISDPAAEFTLTGRQITTQAISASGIDPLSLDVSGAYANQTLTLTNAELDVGTGSLTASGTVGDELVLDLAIDELPVGLANGFVEGLGAQGTISGTGMATGSLSDPQAEFSLQGRGITTADIARSGIAPLTLDAAGSFSDGTLSLQTAELDVGTGSLIASGTVGENLDIDVDLNALPVGLANGFVEGLGAEGTISGTASATGSLSDPNADFQLNGSGITTRQLKDGDVAPLTLEAAGSYANGTLTLANAALDIGSGSLTASGTVGDSLDITADLEALPVALANGFVEGLGAQGTISGTARATGPLANPDASFDLQGSGITTAQIARSNTPPLSFDAAGAYADGTVRLETAAVNVGNGSLTASGTIGQTLDVSLALNQLPVGLANGFVEGLGAQGTLSGTAEATGSVSNPNAAFDISASNVSVAQSRAAGAPAIDAAIAGTYADQAVDLSQAVFNVGPGRITVTGSASAGNLDLDVAIANLPASIASAAAPGIDPQGTINGTVSVDGSPSSPSVQYDIDASGVSVAQTRNAGIGALAIDTSGTFANNVVTTDTSVSGAGIALDASGSVNLSGTPTLNIAVDGTAPLELANRTLAEGGRSITGTVAVDANITGPVTQPNVTGSISTSGARFVDATANLVVDNITTRIDLNGQTATISTFSANLGQGGTIEAGGTVSLAAPFDANISVRLDDGRYTDGEIVTATLSADLAITGPLTDGPTIAGTITSDEINVLVPENLPSSLARIDVTHVNANPAVYEQQRELNPESAAGTSGSAGVNLDITFSAPNQVFVRGRGLDLELGGTIQIEGNSASPEITGAFDLIRGRFGILGKRLDFQEGTLTFTGNLVPTLDLLASSTSGDVTVFIAVTGPADDPSFTFSSNPNLPQDEVLARLIFQQGTSDLSPLQIAQLAEAAASLAGVGGSTGLLENLRSQLGVDDLDISTTADGETAVGAGKYINDNIYLGVDSTGRVSVDLNLGAGLKARGSVNGEGSSEVGVFYEGEF
ncbi:translocation/assembly module TamB domain-containing protein [Fulvimarina sp. 2208YS6-2-32]|uniref:Translocation/assembly module TamB domain-containing protein n=1 Tax=Fulvimarina uroteuthidis TaxID=3098149 RepID=A0ABU5HYG7_9HYPH|nr:translocation/assembly module TamB domain-containing protein [Fulvimarina sp. 2208YS6-2-32]MDY8108169.1 translocation/assembly module TamB domain-containing protein [Fulvimarina sp. 2208YS6-2-32]